MRLFSSISVIAALSLAACDGGEPADPEDAGATPPDAAAHDAGAEPDASRDAGPPAPVGVCPSAPILPA